MSIDKKTAKAESLFKYTLDQKNGPKGQDHIIRKNKWGMKIIGFENVIDDSDGEKKKCRRPIKERSSKIGILIACLTTTGEIAIGWSKRNVKSDTKYSNEFGLNTAIIRALDGRVSNPAHSLKQDYINFASNCKEFNIFEGRHFTKETNLAIENCGDWIFNNQKSKTWEKTSNILNKKKSSKK